MLSYQYNTLILDSFLFKNSILFLMESVSEVKKKKKTNTIQQPKIDRNQRVSQPERGATPPEST